MGNARTEKIKGLLKDGLGAEDIAIGTGIAIGIVRIEIEDMRRSGELGAMFQKGETDEQLLRDNLPAQDFGVSD